MEKQELERMLRESSRAEKLELTELVEEDGDLFVKGRKKDTRKKGEFLFVKVIDAIYVAGPIVIPYSGNSDYADGAIGIAIKRHAPADANAYIERLVSFSSRIGNYGASLHVYESITYCNKNVEVKYYKIRGEETKKIKINFQIIGGGP